jgi:hypothetical protein
MFYMTLYVAKFDDDTSDLLAIATAFKGFERESVLETTDERERLRHLIIRINYLRQCSLQFSGEQVAAMLLNIGEDGMHYTNCKFSRINLFKFDSYICSADINSQVIISHLDLDDRTASQSEEEEDSEDEYDIEEQKTCTL